MQTRKIGFITGLKAEARLLRDTGFLVGVGGGTQEGADHAAKTLVARGALALVSFGLAGGLDPEMKSGTILVPNAIIEKALTYPCDYALMELLGGTTGRPIMSRRKIAVSVADKTALYARNRAVAVDLESGAVARVATTAGLPFAALRAIVDTAFRDLPPAALVPLDEDGGIDLSHILLSILRHPLQIPGLLGLAKDAGRARNALMTRLKRLG